MKDEDDIPEHSHIEHLNPNDKELEKFKKQVEVDLLTIGITRKKDDTLNVTSN
jgi:hypothetical protein